MQIGDSFRQGLARASGISTADYAPCLKLRGRIGGDRAVSLRAIGQILLVVETADLSANRLGPDGAKALASSISESTTLKKLDLSENHLGSDGAQAIAAAVAKNVSLTNVDMRANHFEESDEAQLRMICAERRTRRHRLDVYCDGKPNLLEFE